MINLAHTYEQLARAIDATVTQAEGPDAEFVLLVKRPAGAGVTQAVSIVSFAAPDARTALVELALAALEDRPTGATRRYYPITTGPVQ